MHSWYLHTVCELRYSQPFPKTHKLRVGKVHNDGHTHTHDACTHTHIHIDAHTYIHACTHTYAQHTYIRVHTYIHIHTYIPTHTHTHTHTHTTNLRTAQSTKPHWDITTLKVLEQISHSP